MHSDLVLIILKKYLCDHALFFSLDSADLVIENLNNGYELTPEWLAVRGFNVPLLIHNKEGLDLKVPPSNFTIQDVENNVGECAIQNVRVSAFLHWIWGDITFDPCFMCRFYACNWCDRCSSSRRTQNVDERVDGILQQSQQTQDIQCYQPGMFTTQVRKKISAFCFLYFESASLSCLANSIL